MAGLEDEANCFPESLVCPLCLHIFEDATLLSCGHTFCRKCLKMYDASHQDLDQMMCLLCRSSTDFDEHRVEGLPTNVTINGLVDDYHGSKGDASLESIPKCTTCKVKDNAVSFCKECKSYMCESCQDGHERMATFFGDHEVIPVTDISNGAFKIQRHPNRCSVHKSESKDLFCDQCKVYICFKCVIVMHGEHKIKKQSDIKEEIRVKVDDLIGRFKAKKTKLEKNIEHTEQQCQEVQTAVQKLEAAVRQEHENKAQQLQENHRVLLENIQSLQKGFDEELAKLMAKDQHMIKSIADSATPVAQDRAGSLEADSLAARMMHCDELEQMLKDVRDDVPAASIWKNACAKAFRPSDDKLLALGDITQLPMRIAKEVDLQGSMFGLTTISDDSVVIGYWGDDVADEIDISGKKSQYFSHDDRVYDIAHQKVTGNTSFLNEDGFLYMHSPDGSLTPTTWKRNRYACITCNARMEIILTREDNCVTIFDSSLTSEVCSIKTIDPPLQALETRSGIVIVSTCYNTNPGKVTAYDRSGVVGGTLTADEGEYLYAAVDSRDRVYVARVNGSTGQVVITQYELEGLEFKEMFQFNELKVVLSVPWCYLKSLSNNTLAFACSKKLYFLEFNPA